MSTHFILLTFLHLATSYTVIPDGGYYPNATCLQCHNLQYYLHNRSKYFTSNTQLLLLPGVHHLYTDLIIQNVHDISIIGRDSSTSSVIQCNSSVGIIMKNITNLLIENMVIRNCFTHYLSSAAVILTECSDVKLQYLQIYQVSHTNGSSLQVHNMMGDLYLYYLACDEGLQVRYFKANATINDHMIHLEHYNISDNFTGIYAIFVDLRLSSNSLMLQISNVIIKRLKKHFLRIQAECIVKCNTIVFNNCWFNNYKIDDGQALLNLFHVNVYFNNCHFVSHDGNHNSMIISISGKKSITIVIIYCIFHHNKVTGLIGVSFFSNMTIENSDFYDNIAQIISYIHTNEFTSTQIATIIIKNTTFFSNKISRILQSLLRIKHARLMLMGPVKFYDTRYTNPSVPALMYLSTIISLYKSIIIVNGYIEFSQNKVVSLIEYLECVTPECFTMTIGDTTTLVITNNTMGTYFIANWDYSIEISSYPPCFFQYLNISTKDRYTNYLIISKNNKINFAVYAIVLAINDKSVILASDFQEVGLPITHCYWLPHSTFTTTIPLDVNEKYIKFTNNSKYLPQIATKKLLCYCTNDMHYDCYKDDLGYVYPGQTAVVSFCFPDNSKGASNVAVSVDLSKNETHFTPCEIYRPTELIQFVGKECTTLQYTLVFSNDNWCELFLKLSFKGATKNNVFYVRQLLCPLGFIKKNGICQCYPLLELFGITNCDINNQTILRPNNSWISAASQSSYYISLDCPYHYCIQRSFHLNLSTPDSQCQFNRSGVLCGRCQIGLSTVFGSPNCQHCSNVYLLLIIPIAIAGIVLVLLLFFFNVTVTDGAINAFILYVNIISINSVVFFPYNQNTVAYMFISFANLDLGIQTCFYNGMDDYAKMWLQLAFPFYLIFIATLLIFSSRYSNRIQKITAHRALPVLATLFLLSYTKILRTVSIVLFFYSSITHLPTKHTRHVWSIDPNVSLFGVKLTPLFVVCIILFLILVPFNTILVFTKMFSRFNIVTKFKPLLDAYQGPYKIKFYYWTGLQLMLRTVFFGLSSLDTKINFIVGFIILGIINIVHGYTQPFKSMVKNILETLFIVNLIGLYTFILSFGQNDIYKVTAVNLLIIVAGGQLLLIVLYHIFIYACSEAIKKRATLMLDSWYNVLARWMNRLHKKPDQQFQLGHCNIPEVTYNYHEYQEPLIGQEYNQ